MGIPVMFKDYENDILMFDPVLDLRESIEISEDEKEYGYHLVFDPPLTTSFSEMTDKQKRTANGKLYNDISFQYIFEKKTFTFNYYTVLDLFTELCGIGNGIAAVLAQYYVYIIMLFAIQLNFLVKQKHKKDFDKFRYESLIRKVPSYKLVIEKSLKEEFMSKATRKTIKKADKLAEEKKKKEAAEKKKKKDKDAVKDEDVAEKEDDKPNEDDLYTRDEDLNEEK